MGRYFVRLLKAALISTLGVGCGIGAFIMICIIIIHNGPDKFQIAMQFGLLLGIVFSVLFLMMQILLDLSARMYFAKGQYNEVWEMDQAREINLNGTSKEVLAVSREALLAVPYVKSVQEDAENLIALAETGTSWRSVGESLEVEINPVSENNWLVKCISKPVKSSIVFDYGKNFENVEAWYAKVKGSKLISTRGPDKVEEKKDDKGNAE